MNNAKNSETRTSFFPEWQIYYRSNGIVHYLTLSTHMQMLAAAVTIILASWLAWASAYFLLDQTRPAVMQTAGTEHEFYLKKLQQARARETAALSLLEEKTTAFQQLTGEFEQRHQLLRQLLGELRQDEALAPDAKGRESILIRPTINDAEPRQHRSYPLAAAPDAGTLQKKTRQIGQAQLQFLDLAEQTLAERREHQISILNITGIDIRTLQDNSDKITANRNMSAKNPFQLRSRQVAARIKEMRRLDELMQAVPLGNPVGAPSRLTSSFGQRKDPFNGQITRHSGIDITAYPQAPVIASAPGQVSFAAQQDGYGNIVEINHGFGFKSRYAHLHSITAKTGEQVQKGRQIGTMGSSGRSTGIHLHYEISFKNQKFDPKNFLEAGEYVKYIK